MAVVYTTDDQTVTLVSATTDTGNLDFTFGLGSNQLPNLSGDVCLNLKTDLTAGSDLTPISIVALPIVNMGGANHAVDTSQAITIDATFTMVDGGYFFFTIDSAFGPSQGVRITIDVSGLTATTGVKFTANLTYS